MDRFLKEKATRCSAVTIKGYKSDLKIFFTWNMEENDDKYFPNIYLRPLLYWEIV